MRQMGLTKKLLHLMKVPQVITDYSKDKKDIVRREQKVIDYLKSWCPELTEDEVGNLYLINNNTPLICAHMDTVGSANAQQLLEFVEVVKPNKPTKQVDVKGNRDTNKTGKDIIIGADNIGADDKCGIAIAMQLYEELGDKISLLFTVGEESGGVGVNHFVKHNSKLLDDITYCIIPDRTNAGDIICSHNDYGTDLFEDKLVEFSQAYGFKPAMGVWCDADTLSEYVNCVNMSTGYYGHHTSKEYVVVDEFKNAYEAIKNIVVNFNEKMEKPNKDFSYRNINYGYPRGFGFEDDYGYGDEVYMEDNETIRITKDIVLYSANGDVIPLKKGEYFFDVIKEDNDDLYY